MTHDNSEADPVSQHDTIPLQGPPQSPPEETRLHITEADLQSAEVVNRVEAMQAAQRVPLYREVGEASQSKPRWWQHALVWMTAAGLVGGLLAWFLLEYIIDADSTTRFGDDDAQLVNVVFTATMALVIGLVISLVDAFQAGGWSKVGRTSLIALPTALISGLVVGLVASQIYQSMTKNLVEDAVAKWTQLLTSGTVTESEALEGLQRDVTNGLHVPRGLAWMPVGIAVGIVVGAASRSWRRTINTVAGGAIGGLIAGFVFDYFNSGTTARLVGIVLTGLLVGVGMGIVETIRRSMWLEIVSGGMSGKQFIVYDPDITIGSAPSCSITLIKDPNIAPTHARLVRKGGRTEISRAADQPLLVNGTDVERADVQDMSTLQLGSTVLRVREKSGNAIPTSGPIVPGRQG
jgi:hypothetical protein